MVEPPPGAPGVLHLLRPAPDTVAAAATACAALPFSYAECGATRAELPADADHDSREVVVGHGEATWVAAKAALRGWRQFDLGWVHLLRHDLPLAEGQLVTFASRQLGVWALNVCRIVYVVDEPRCFGFAYGTLSGHVVAGEEQFLLRWDPETDAVTFRIRKFSRPQHPLVRLAAPFARRVQRRFTADALDALARAARA